MAVVDRQVNTTLSADESSKQAHMKVAPMTAQSILTATIAAAQSPATVASTAAPTSGNAFVLDSIIAATNPPTTPARVYFGIGSEIIDTIISGNQSFPLNFEGAADGTLIVSGTTDQSVTVHMSAVYHELDK